MWYEKNYRRHLCDMHIEDWSEEFLSKFSPEEYVKNLLDAKIQNAMLPFQTHVGLCYYPTKIGCIHNAFRKNEDLIKRTADLCRKNGIAVTGYYSLSFNTREHDRHPQWRMVMQDGKSMRERRDFSGNKMAFGSAQLSRYGWCCPNNIKYRGFVYKQIDEIFEYFNFDGLFFDMPFWKHTCYCSKCKDRWKNEIGGEMPLEPVEDNELHIKLLKKKYQWMGEWIQSVTDYVKRKNPNITVEHNFSQSIEDNSETACGEEVGMASDFVGGDLYGGIVNHSLACKFFKNITKNEPFEYMFSRCKPSLSMHTLSKSFDEIRTEVLLTAAHHGATMVIDAIDPVGTVDKRFYKLMGEVFEIQKKYEPYFCGKMREDVGLYYSIRSRFAANGIDYNNLACAKGAAASLIENNIPFGVVGNFRNYKDYKTLIIPALCDMESSFFDDIENYIKNGGNVYLSGADSKALIERLLNCKYKGVTEAVNVYIAPTAENEKLFLGFNEEYPFPFEGKAPIVECESDCEVLAYFKLPYTNPGETRFASIHSNPPGIPTAYPAVLRRSLGKGNIIWSGVALEAINMYEYKKIFTNLLGILTEDFSFSSNAPSNVEITVFDCEDGIIVNTIVLNEKAFADKVLPFEISVKSAISPKSVNKLPEGESIPFKYTDGCVKFSSDVLDIFDMYKIEF